MGLLDFIIGLFSGQKRSSCPSCGAPGAIQADNGMVHCKNPSCPYFDPALAVSGKLRQARTTIPTRGDFRAEHPVAIRYRNFQGEEREFSAELGSIERKRNHLVARIAPTGKKVTLSRDRIQNLAEVEQVMPPRVSSGQAWPTARECQILGYHKKHGTTSARYEQVRAKYPNW